jgi:glutamine amidotransferase
MVTIVDYGLGNVEALLRIFHQLGIASIRATSSSDLLAAERVILPGVGAFDWAMQRLNASGMREQLTELVQERQIPLLGICVGMQMLAQRSDEGELPGLGWVSGVVQRFDVNEAGAPLQLPHMGWNDLLVRKDHPLLEGLSEPRFYFLHSYRFVDCNPSEVLAETEYGRRFPSVVQCGNVYGVQCHPEKSHHWGLTLLKNFAGIRTC